MHPFGAVGLCASAAAVAEPLAVRTASAAECFVWGTAGTETLGLASWLSGFSSPDL